MALGSKKSEAVHSRDGAEKTALKASFDAGNHTSLEMYPGEAALIYQMQQMQEDIEELRRYITAEVGDGATGSRGPSGARGAAGSTGSAGSTGTRGADGSDGARGAAGADGTTPTMTSLSGSGLPTRKPASGLLWNDRGVVKIG